MRPIRYYMRRAAVWTRWLTHDLPKAPRLQLYARRQDILNRKIFLQQKNQSVAERFTAFDAAPMPRIIWMYWDSGEAGAPFVVARCIKSWRRHNPDWEIRVLDAKTVSKYADLSGMIAKTMPARLYADMLRLKLLKDHGGVWADATVYCHRPLDEWLPLATPNGFFTFRNPGADRWLSSWFLASTAGHRLISLWEEGVAAFFAGQTRMPDQYFIIFYIFQHIVGRDAEAHELWCQGAALPARPALMMMPVLEGQLSENLLRAQLRAGLPVSKLSWKTEVEEDRFQALCARLESRSI